MFSFLKKKKILVTHSESFHTDDIFACAILQMVLNKKGYRTKVIRSRDEDIIAKGDYVFDVGRIYDPAINRFDHHQKEGAGSRDNGIPYAACGLVWKHFGKELVSSNSIFQKIDDVVISPIDAGDNGYDLFESKIAGINPFEVGKLFSIVFRADSDSDRGFVRAVAFAKIFMINFIEKLEFNETQKIALIAVYELTKDKRIIVIDEPVGRKIIWETYKDKKDVHFAVYHGEGHDRWHIVAMRDSLSEFTNRYDLPKEWAGLQDLELQQVTGVSDAVFCHRNLFLAAAISKEGAVALAQLALNENN
jgi:uncharacterized UPF0160 family protein